MQDAVEGSDDDSTGDDGSWSAAPDGVVKVLRRRAATTELWLEVTGPSMAPTIREPARVRVIRADRPRLGEVWAFVALDGSVVVHRYLWRYRDRRRGFRGDGVGFDDPPVADEHLVGRVDLARDARGERHLERSAWRVVLAQARRARNIAQRLIRR